MSLVLSMLKALIPGFPVPFIQQVSGISTTAPQATGDPTSTYQDTHTMSWVFSLPDTKRTGQSCIVFPSLWLSWWTKGKKDSSGHCGLMPALSPLAVCCTCATALELSLPFACVISRVLHCHRLKVTEGDKQRCRWVSELIWGNHHYIPAMFICHRGIMQILHILGPCQVSDNTLRC